MARPHTETTTVDQTRIDEIARDVLSKLAEPSTGAEDRPDVDARLAALERAVFGGRAVEPSAAAPTVGAQSVSVTIASQPHPSEGLLRVAGGAEGGPCILEPGKPCEKSGRCRTFGF